MDQALGSMVFLFQASICFLSYTGVSASMWAAMSILSRDLSMLVASDRMLNCPSRSSLPGLVEGIYQLRDDHRVRVASSLEAAPQLLRTRTSTSYIGRTRICAKSTPPRDNIHSPSFPSRFCTTWKLRPSTSPWICRPWLLFHVCWCYSHTSQLLRSSACPQLRHWVPLRERHDLVKVGVYIKILVGIWRRWCKSVQRIQNPPHLFL